MGNIWNKENADRLLKNWLTTYDIYAPVLYPGDGCYSDTDVVRYGKITSPEEIVWDKKSDYSFKEALLPLSETMMYFTDTFSTVPESPRKRIIFLRSCDLHAVKRLDEIYLNNGPADFYYQRIRKDTKFILIGCTQSFPSCFCTSMGTNTCEGHHGYIHPDGKNYYMEISDPHLLTLADESSCPKADQPIQFVKQNDIRVTLPEALPSRIASHDMWKEYTGRCIGCGRCNFVCPTCTCFSTQDIFYRDNDHKNSGERRRVWSSCQVDGYTDMAGGLCFRKDQGERMRFKVLHKVSDYKKRFGYHMCVGCGRCENICPEYISYISCLHKLHQIEKGESE